jgi:hypothetical protein
MFLKPGRTHYSLAVLNKSHTASKSMMDSEEFLFESESLEKESEILLKKNEILPAIEKLIISTNKYEDAYQKRMIASILTNNPMEPIKAKNPYERLHDIVDMICLECVKGDAQQARIGFQLPQPLIITSKYNKTIPISKLPLIVTLPANSDIFADSDDKGTVIVRINHIKNTGYSKNEIRIRPAWNKIISSALHGLPASWENRLNNQYDGIQVSYYIRTPSSTTIDIVTPKGILIDGKLGALKEELIVQPLIEQLKTSRFLVKHIDKCDTDCDLNELIPKYKNNANLLILINSSVQFSSWRNTNPLYRAHLSLICYDYVRNEIIGSTDGESMGAASNKLISSEKAIESAIYDYIPQFLQEVKDKLQ